MKESKTVRARQTEGGVLSLLPGFVRRKRVIVTLLAIIGSFLLLNYWRPGGIMGWLDTKTDEVPFDEFQGLLYYLTKSDDLLPAQMDGSEAQNPDVWSGGVHWTPAQWEARLTIMRKENPVIIFSKTYCPFSKRAKAILAEYPLKKTPTFIEADLRPDGPKIKALLTRLTGQGTFPNVVIGGKPLGGADRTTVLHESGSLKKRLQKARAL